MDIKSIELKRNIYWILGGSILLFAIFLSIGAPFFAKSSYSTIDLFSINAAPNSMHILGTDSLGRDIFARLLYGMGVSLSVGIISTFMQILIGTTLGTIAAYFGKGPDFIIMRIIDIVMCFPFIITAMAIAAIIGPSLSNLVIIISILSWTDVARIVRAEVLSLKKQNFIIMSKTIGFSDIFIIIKHILPNVLPMIIVAASISMANSILIEASLSFLGMGVKDPMPSLGNILSNAQNMRALQSYPWTWLPAGLVIISIVLAINFIGEGFRIFFNPKQRNTKKALEFEVDLDIEKGKIMALIGESGSGKTLSTRAILRLNSDNINVKGRVMFEGKNLLKLSKKELKKVRGRDITLMFQEPMRALDPLMKLGDQVDEVLLLYTKLSKKERYDRVIELFKEVSLPEPQIIYYKFPHQVSGGMRQRVQMAVAIASDPKLLIADEPTAAIDEELKNDILSLLYNLCKKRNMAIILISHELSKIEKYVDEVAVMYKGKIVEKQNAKDFFESPKHPYSNLLLKSVINKATFTGRFYEGELSEEKDEQYIGSKGNI